MRLIIVAVFLCCQAWCGLAHAQTTPTQLLDELKNARAKIKSYALTCRVHGPMGNIWNKLPTDRNSETEIYFEWSKSNEHAVVAVRMLPEKAWRIRGISGDVCFQGDNTAKVKTAMFHFEPDADHTLMKLFDPFVMGLGFRNEFENGNNFDSMLNSLQQTAKRPGLMSKVVVQGELAKWRYNLDTEIVFDTKRSFWPIALSYPTQTSPKIAWKLELAQKFGFDLPVRATLLSRTEEREERTIVDMDWLSINEPFAMGQPTIRRLSEKFDVEIEKPAG